MDQHSIAPTPAGLAEVDRSEFASRWSANTGPLADVSVVGGTFRGSVAAVEGPAGCPARWAPSSARAAASAGPA